MTRTRRSLLIAVTVVGGALLAVGFVWAFLTGTGNGTVTATVGVLNPATNVTVPSTSGSPVHVTWTATSAPGGGNVTGYYVQRYAGATPYAACGTSSSSLLAGSATSCDDTVGIGGTYTYKVVAVWHSWTSTSAASGSVVVTAAIVGAPSPTSGNVGSSVTITGSSFPASTALAVTVGGTTASITAGGTSDSSGNVNVTFTVPAKPAGAYAVVVTGGIGSATSGTNFTITRSVTLSPTSGLAGAAVTVSGAAFPASSTVTATWDGGALALTPASPLTDAPGSITGVSFTVPGSTGGAHTVQITAGAQSVSTTFTVTLPSCAAGNNNEYLSVASGNWNATATWIRCNGSAWVAAVATPTSTDAAVTVQNATTVTVSAAVTVDQVTTAVGGTLSISNGVTLTVANGSGTDLAVNGTVTVNGTTGSLGVIALNASAAVVVDNGGSVGVTGAINLGSASPYGSLTVGATGAGAVTGTLTVSSGGAVYGTGANDFTVNTRGQVTVAGTGNALSAYALNLAAGACSATPNFKVDGTLTLDNGTAFSSCDALRVNGTLAITQSSAGTASLTGNRGNGGGVGTINSGGSVVISGTGSWSVAGTGNAVVTVANGGTLELGASTKVDGVGELATSTGSTLKIASSAGITASGATGNVQTGTRTFGAAANYVYNGASGQVTGTGLTAANDLTISAATTLTSTTAVSGTLTTNGALTVPNAVSLTLTGSTTSSASASGSVVVNSGGTLGVGASATLGGAGGFTLNSGGTLQIASVNGITASSASGSIQTATRSFSTGANYTFNGTAAQATGDGLPATVHDMTINDAAGVTLTNAVTLSNNGATNATLTLAAGTVTTGANSFVVSATASGVVTGAAGISGTLTANGALTMNSGGTLTVSGSSTVNGSGAVSVSSGGTLALGASATVSGSGTFTLNSGGNIQVGATAGITSSGASGNVQTAGSRTYNGAANYLYNGTAAQVTGNGLPATVTGNITVSNAAGLSLSGTLSLGSGGLLEVLNGGMVTLSPTDVLTGTGTGKFQLDAGGTLQIGSTGGIANSGATGNVQTPNRTYSTSGNYVYNGTAAQVSGTGLTGTVNNATFNNTSGVTLTGSVTVSGTLDIAGTPVSTGANTLTVSSDVAVGRTTGYVTGSLKLHVATGTNVARTFPVGTAGGYTPVDVVFASVTGQGSMTIVANANDSPNIGTSTLVASKSLNRYWTFSNSGINFTTYSATFNFPGTFGSTDAQLDTGTNTANLRVGKFTASAWSYPTLGTRTSTSTQATGISNFGDFQLAE